MKGHVKSCYLVCAGQIDLPLKINKGSNDKIFAVDGGLKILNGTDLKPDMVVGDFDSLGFRPQAERLLCLPVEKDVTDSYAAAMLAADEGFKRIVIFGGTGGRTEHTFANVQLLNALAKRGVKAFLTDGARTMTVSDGGTVKISAKKSGYVSVFSLDAECEGVTLKGLKYPLSRYTLTNSYPIGVSNEFTGQAAEITAEKGAFLVVAECGPDDFS